MIEFLIGVLVFVFLNALSWAICLGMMYLICLCFSLEFNILIATGVWLILCFIKMVFPSKKGGVE